MEFLPVDVVASYYEVQKSSLISIYHHKEYKGRDLKFKKDEQGKLLVNMDYKYPLASKVEKLREQALETAKTEYNLSKEIAKLTGKKVDTIQRYFYRFTFKNTQTADEIINALETYISRNSLFGAIA